MPLRDYAWSQTIQTRWRDNDIYGHVNNVVFYSWFDTAINRYLIEEGGLDIHDGPVIGVAAESFCRFLRPVAFPDTVVAGLRVGHLGERSVRYEIGVFAGGDTPVAEGHFVHVFVDRATFRPTPIPEEIRTSLAALATSGEEGPN